MVVPPGWGWEVTHRGHGAGPWRPHISRTRTQSSSPCGLTPCPSPLIPPSAPLSLPIHPGMSLKSFRQGDSGGPRQALKGTHLWAGSCLWDFVSRDLQRGRQLGNGEPAVESEEDALVPCLAQPPPQRLHLMTLCIRKAGLPLLFSSLLSTPPSPLPHRLCLPGVSSDPCAPAPLPASFWKTVWCSG